MDYIDYINRKNKKFIDREYLAYTYALDIDRCSKDSTRYMSIKQLTTYIYFKDVDKLYE